MNHKKEIATMDFEEAMAELESVVNALESDQVSLDKSIKLYQRGAALKNHCAKKLKTAEEKINQITFDADGVASGLQVLRN